MNSTVMKHETSKELVKVSVYYFVAEEMKGYCRSGLYAAGNLFDSWASYQLVCTNSSEPQEEYWGVQPKIGNDILISFL